MMAKIYINNGGYTEVTKVGIKNSGSWVKNTISTIYQKINGVWSNNISNGGTTKYTFGGFIETTSEGGTITSDTEYNPSGTHEPNTDIIYTQSPGYPNVKTDENGNVVEYTFTNTGTTGVTTSNVDTGIIAFDQSNPGWTLHLVAEFTPSDSTETNAIILANNGGSSQGLTVYTGSGNYCYCKIKTQAYDTNGSKFKAWSTFSPTGNDTNYYKNRNEITFDITYTTDKKFTLTINNKATDYTNYSYDMTLNGITIMVGKEISNFTIKEFSVVKI